MTLPLQREMAIDLLEFKLRHIQDILQEILRTWNEKDVESFLEKAKSGNLEEAEMDAITVEQLLIDIEKYQTVLNKMT